MKLIHKNFDLNNIRHVIFDKDGTLTDAHVYWSEIIRRRSIGICSLFDFDSSYAAFFQESMGLFGDKLSQYGPIAIKSRKQVIDSILLSCKQLGLSPSFEIIDQLFADIHRNFAKESLHFIKPIPSALNFIQACSNYSVVLSLATSDSQANTQKVLQHLGLAGTFEDRVLCNDSGFGDKHSGKPAVELCRMSGVSTEHTIIIGDAPMDYDMGFSSGVSNCLLVATGQIPLPELRKITSFSCNSLSEILIHY